MKCSVYKLCIFVFPSNCLYTYSYHPIEPLIIEHMIIMATTTKIAIEHNLLLI